ncbi:MAG: 2-phospho-L-lactate guanylyltransferase [Halobacteria archaeon]
MKIFVPFEPRDPKTRLSPVLSESERREFSVSMLRDVVSAVRGSGNRPVLLSTVDGEFGLPEIDVRIDDRPLDAAVNAVLEEYDRPLAVLMSDLAIADPDSVRKITDPVSEGGVDLALAPGLRGGTNGFAVRDKEFRVNYHGTSFRDHIEVAEGQGTGYETVDSLRLGIDIDEPCDLVEVLIHGEGESYRYLNERFRLDTQDSGEVRLESR